MKPIDPQTEKTFASIWSAAAKSNASTIHYDCDHSKHEFLQYLVARHDMVLHGSNMPQLATLQPRRAGGVAAEQALAAVYATDSVAPK